MLTYDSPLYRLLVLGVVVAAYANIYVIQPVLPVMQQEFAASKSGVSLTVSGLIAGIALANLPIGMLADRYPLRPLLVGGGISIAAAGIFGAFAADLRLVVFARFVQGLALPTLITCVAAFLSRTLPVPRLRRVMGAFVAATVAGGLLGRLLGGWLHSLLDWRFAMAIVAFAAGALAVVAAVVLPDPGHASSRPGDRIDTVDLLRRVDVTAMYATAFCAFFVFSSVFNYLPFRLQEAPLSLSSPVITATYLTYVVGIAAGPLAGRWSHRIGGGMIIAAGTAVASAGILLTLVTSLRWVVVGLLLLCAGFFAVHAAAAGVLNARAASAKGRANALYVMFYYVGGFLGITVSGYAYEHSGWLGVIGLGAAVMVVPLLIGLNKNRNSDEDAHPPTGCEGGAKKPFENTGP